jgi:hypothetical protein
MGTSPDSLGMTSYTLAILLLALIPIVKKLFSIEIVIYDTAFCSPLALMVLEKKIFKEFAVL